MNNQCVVFSNKGCIDIRSVKTFGVSAKEGTNPIGYFGTGLKYAIAILLRHGQEVEMWVDGVRYYFALKKTTIRNKEFEIITMNDEEMPYTTELGKNWELWQAFREIYCNCIDEKGDVHLIQFNGVEPHPQHYHESEGKTVFMLRGPESVLAYHERDSIVLNIPDSKRIGEGKVEIFDRASKYIYYRGVRVVKLDKPSMFTYNLILESGLTEDRTLSTPAIAIMRITQAVALLTNKDHLLRIMFEENCFERQLEFSSLTAFNDESSSEFEAMAKSAFESNSDKFHPSIRMWFKEKTNRSYLKEYQPVQLNSVQKSQFDRCQRILKQTYGHHDSEIDYLFVRTLGEHTMANAEIHQKRVVIAQACFDRGTKYLLSTIIEELEHIRTGYNDCTREFQTHLFDMICTLIENHVIQEPV